MSFRVTTHVHHFFPRQFVLFLVTGRRDPQSFLNGQERMGVCGTILDLRHGWTTTDTTLGR